MKVVVGETVKNNSPVFPVGVKTPDGIFSLDSPLIPIGKHILVCYEPDDQFAYVVNLERVAKLLWPKGTLK